MSINFEAYKITKSKTNTPKMKAITVSVPPDLQYGELTLRILYVMQFVVSLK